MKPRAYYPKPFELAAALEGRLSQIRVPLKPQPWASGHFVYWTGENFTYEIKDAAEHAPFQPGTILAWKETWCHRIEDYGPVVTASGGYDTSCCYYREGYDGPHLVRWDEYGGTDYNKDGSEGSPWKSPVTQPLWAVRLFYRVTSVRVERFQSMTDLDAICCGVMPATTEPCGADSHEPVQVYLDWDANPWQWVYDLEPVDREEVGV